ncbi:hypothetical protein AB8878_07355 [Alphaproteobacteria bacterium LSUCC0226]
MVSMSLLLALAFISTLKIEGREAKVITDVYGVTGVTEEEKEEDKILRFINRNNNIPVTSRDIQRGTKLKAQQVQSSLYRLMEAKLVVANENKYQLAG